jgi:cytochrome c5
MKKFILIFLVYFPILSYSQEFELGKELFKTNCASCHKMDAKLVGPPLQNTIQDQGRDWTSKWIQNSQLLIESGDAHAVEIYEEYNQMAMPGFSWLPPEELEAILDYMEGYNDNKEVVVEPTTDGGTDEVTTEVQTNTEIPRYVSIFIFIAIVIITLSIVVIIVAIKLLDKFFTKIELTNYHLMKKLNLDEKSVNSEVETVLDREVTKRLEEKVKTLKSDLDNQIKNFK